MRPHNKRYKTLGLCGYASILPRIKFGVTGQDSSPHSPTFHTANRCFLDPISVVAERYSNLLVKLRAKHLESTIVNKGDAKLFTIDGFALTTKDDLVGNIHLTTDGAKRFAAKLANSIQ